MNAHHRPIFITLLAIAACTTAGAEISPERMANTVVLDKQRAENLGIETVTATKTDFEETLFSLGRIAVIPSKRGVVSSRIPGRILEMKVFEGDIVESGQVAVVIESRQPGNPPPRIELKAPLGGLVMATHSSIGEPIAPETDILEINDLSEVFAVARIPEDQAGRVQPGIRARIVIPALPGESFEGEMLRFGTTADREGGTIDALFVLKGLDGHVRPDMRAEFSIVTSLRTDVTSLPREAIQGGRSNPYVFVEDFELDYAYVKTPVKVGARNDRFVEVVSGLFPADNVVTRGAYPLAFAGAGSISLKDALDQAHGHEHNEDGSEMTAEQKSAKASGGGEAGSGGTRFGGPWAYFFAALSTLLAVLLLLSWSMRRQSTDQVGTADA